MLSTIVLLLTLLAAGGSSFFAIRERRRTRREVDNLVRGIEARTRPEATTGDVADAIPAEIAGLLDEIVQEEQHGLAVLALNDLTGRASLARSRAHSFSRGLSRIALLSGGAGAFAVAALGNFERSALVLALGSVGMGVVSSLTCHVQSRGTRQLARKYGELTDTLARQVEAHFRELNGGEAG